MNIRELKSALLKKGWAGRTLSRSKTVEQLNPLITAHMELNHAYNYAIAHHPLSNVRKGLSTLQKTARTDVGKLMETVFSCGAVPPNGTDMDPAQFTLPSDNILATLCSQEDAFMNSLQQEKTLEHQMRTEAVLNRLLKNSQNRLIYLRGCIRREPLQVSA